MNIKKTTAALLATSALSFGIVGLSNHVMAKPYMDGHDKAHQCERREAKHANKHLKRMVKHLDLTEQQTSEIKAIFEEAHGDGREHSDRKGRGKQAGLMALDPNAGDYQERVEEIASARAKAAEQHVLKRAEIMAKVHAVLTPEQQELSKERKARHLEKFND